MNSKIQIRFFGLTMLVFLGLFTQSAQAGGFSSVMQCRFEKDLENDGVLLKLITYTEVTRSSSGRITKVREDFLDFNSDDSIYLPSKKENIALSKMTLKSTNKNTGIRTYFGQFKNQTFQIQIASKYFSESSLRVGVTFKIQYDANDLETDQSVSGELTCISLSLGRSF